MPDNEQHEREERLGMGGSRSGNPKSDRQAMRWMGYGVEFIGVLGIFTYGGYQADLRLHTTPWLMIAGMLFALTGMIYLLVKETSGIK